MIRRILFSIIAILFCVLPVVAQAPPGWVRPSSLDSSHIKSVAALIKLSSLDSTKAVAGLGFLRNNSVDGAKIVDLSIKKIDVDTATSFTFLSVFKATSAIADSAFVTKKYVDGLTPSPGAQSITKTHIDTTSSNIPFDGAFHGTTAVADSAYATLLYARSISITTTNITNQTIAKDDVDTASSFTFLSAFKVDGSKPDSAFVTKKYVDAGANPFGSTIDSGDMSATRLAILPRLSVDSTKVTTGGLSINNISITGATSGKFLGSNGSNLGWSTIAFDNPIVYGDLLVRGGFRWTNHGSRIDTSNISCTNATTPLIIYPPQVPTACGSDSSAVHPSIVYMPGGWNGYRYWLGVTQQPACNHEDAFIRVSNDAVTWTRFKAAADTVNDTCPDPIFTHNEFIDSAKSNTAYSDYVSDLNIFMGSDGKLWAMARGSWKYADTQRTTYTTGPLVQFSALYVKSTSDGYTWSAAKKVTNITFSSGYAWGVVTFMSPAVWVDTLGSYGMFVIDGVQTVGDSVVASANATRQQLVNRILLYKAPRPDTMWTLVDTVRSAGITGSHTLFPSKTGQVGSTWSLDDSIGAHNYVPWHIGVVGNGGDEQVILLTCVSHDSAAVTAGGVPIFANFIGISATNGRTMSAKFAPILTSTGIVGTFDRSYVYRMAGWWEDRGSYTAMRLVYSGYNPSLTSTWHTAITDINFLPPSSLNPIDSLGVKSGGLTSYNIRSRSLGWDRIANILHSDGTIDTTNGLRVAGGHLQASHFYDSTITGIKISSSTIGMGNINWAREVLEFSPGNVYGMRTKNANDSMRLFFNFCTNGATSSATRFVWMNADTSASAHSDTVRMILTAPYNLILDTIVVNYLDSNAAGYIDSIDVSVSAGALASAADTSVVGFNTNRTATSETRLTLATSARNVAAGQHIILTFVNTFPTTRYYWVGCTGAWAMIRRR